MGQLWKFFLLQRGKQTLKMQPGLEHSTVEICCSIIPMAVYGSFVTILVNLGVR
jgi:hypothetical protein